MGEVKNKRPWQRVVATDQRSCCYCRVKFSMEHPPTFDHVVPKMHGGTLDRAVLACGLCNNARGHAPYQKYREAVDREWERCTRDRRSFRRPKFRVFEDGSWVIDTMTRADIHDRRRARREVGGE